PTVKDRVVQQAVRLVVEPVFEVHFSPMSFGFRPGRGCHQAVGEVAKYLNWGLVHVVEADITDCFGSIPHERLMKAVARRVADKAILRLIRLWLKCGVMEDGRFRKTTTGTPQGGVISPLLANIYLDELDRTWTQRQMARRAGANAHLVRYADDLVILTDKDTSGPEQLLRETLAGMGLALNPDKTRVLDAKTDSFDFLGFNIRKAHNPRSGKWFALVHPSHKAQMALKERIRRLTSPGVQEKVSEVVRRVNPVVRGWVNYFRIGHSAGAFGEVREFVLCRMRRYLCRKQKRHGCGWKRLPNSFFYGELGLFYEYKVEWQPRPAWGLG
ncbi:MAG: group II intron reverse transcriptase/maturase, partial [Elusimicrobia bacterium]|nr:group II intron reverse transcriptase/maturase [Elusimicrobiota bacterium]